MRSTLFGITAGSRQLPPSVAVVSSVTYGGNAAINFTPAMPSHQANDILFVSAPQMASSGVGPVTATGGWAEIAKRAAGMRGTWFWKRAVDGSTAGPTITSDQNADIYAVTYVIRGCVESGTPYEDPTTAGANVGSTPAASSEITTTGVNRLVLCSLGIFEQQAITGYPPSGWTDESNLTDANGGGTRIILASQEVATASTVTAATMGTLSGGNDFDIWESLTLAFIPA